MVYPQYLQVIHNKTVSYPHLEMATGQQGEVQPFWAVMRAGDQGDYQADPPWRGYLAYRKASGRRTSYDEIAQADMRALALAACWLEDAASSHMVKAQ